MRWFAMIIAAALTAPLTSAALAQMAQSETATVNGPAVAAEVKRLLNEQYVLAELRPKFSTMLDQGIAGGRYNVSGVEQLVERLNADLHQVTPDKHLGVMYNPAASRALASAPPNAGADDAPSTVAEIAAAERRNHGIVQLKVLPGNIRYLESDGFVWAGPTSERAYDTAISFLSHGDAVIIDMRKNGGGNPDAVRYLTSHFVEPNKPLMTFQMGARGTARSVALPSLRAPSLAGKPLYVLTSGGTASAAEEFVGHVAGYKLGELIGERTAGAGFRNEFFALPDGLTISISVGQAILASTGKGWEGVGFTPDTLTPVDQALDVARVHALRRIAETADPKRKIELKFSADVLDAQISPVRTELAFAAYAGVYGERAVTVAGDGIVIERKGGSKSKLIAIGPNTFTYENDPGSTLTFDVDAGRATAIHLVRGDGSTADGKRAE